VRRSVSIVPPGLESCHGPEIPVMNHWAILTASLRDERNSNIAVHRSLRNERNLNIAVRHSLRNERGLNIAVRRRWIPPPVQCSREEARQPQAMATPSVRERNRFAEALGVFQTYPTAVSRKVFRFFCRRGTWVPWPSAARPCDHHKKACPRLRLGHGTQISTDVISNGTIWLRLSSARAVRFEARKRRTITRPT